MYSSSPLKTIPRYSVRVHIVYDGKIQLINGEIMVFFHQISSWFLREFQCLPVLILIHPKSFCIRSNKSNAIMFKQIVFDCANSNLLKHFNYKLAGQSIVFKRIILKCDRFYGQSLWKPRGPLDNHNQTFSRGNGLYSIRACLYGTIKPAIIKSSSAWSRDSRSRRPPHSSRPT